MEAASSATRPHFTNVTKRAVARRFAEAPAVGVRGTDMRFAPLKLVCLAPLLAIAAACTQVEPESASAMGELESGGICASLDYGHTTSTTDFYLQFESDTKAAEYVEKALASGQLAGTSGPDAKLKEITHDPRLTKLVAEVFEGFRKSFPKETQDLTTPPRVAIVESESVNAYAMGPGAQGKSPWLFIIHTALLNQTNTDTELRGLFGHELGHLILRTFLPDIQRRVRAIYTIGRSEEGVLGAAQDDDPRSAEHVEKILKIQKRINGLPRLGFPVSLDNLYLKILRKLTTEAAAAVPGAPDPCALANEKIKELRGLQIDLIPNAAQQNFIPLVPTSKQQAELDRLTVVVGNELRSCTAAVAPKMSLLELSTIVNQLPPESTDPAHPDHQKLLGLTLESELRVDAEAPDALLVDRIVRAESALRSELAALQEDPSFPIEQIRVFDYEEDADDAAVRVLSSIGDDPKGNGLFLLSIMPPEAKAACLRDVEAGKPIAFGNFVDTHPSTCWRYYHTTQYEKALGQCGASAASAKRAPKGSGRPSVLDLTPQDAVEKGYGRGQR
jgi:hypothetical protein